MLQRLGSVLYLCAKSGDLRRGVYLHAVLVKSGLDSDVFLCNHLINLYAQCGRISTARKLFDGMRVKNLVSWSLIISGCDKAGEAPAALAHFSEMDCLPNEYIYAGAVSACAHVSALAFGRQIHAFSVKTGHAAMSFVCNSLISFYMKCGRPDDAMTIFSKMPVPNLVSFNAMIAGFAENLQFHRSLDLFSLMNARGMRADQFSLVAALGSLAGAGREGIRVAGGAAALHCLAVKLGLDRSAFVGNAMLSLYSGWGSFEEAEMIFQSIDDKDMISCNTFIAACSRHGEHARALSIFKTMTENSRGAKLDGFAFAGALAACAGLASINHGGQIHAQILRKGASSMDAAVCNALMNMYAKCGKICNAETIFRLLPEKNRISWNTMIAGFGSHGEGRRALELFNEMVTAGISPDACSFSGLLAACSHSGMVDEGRAVYASMAKGFGINPGPEHLSSMVDLLGRAGRLEEAEGYLKASFSGDDSVLWGSLLSSCRLHGDLGAGRRVAEKLLELRPGSSSPYVLLSSLYAFAGRWGEAARARRLLKSSGVRKEPGHSSIEVDGVV